MHRGQNTHAPRSMLSGFKEMAPAGQGSTHFEKPSGQREESIFGLPRNLSGKIAAATSGITGSPWARRTVTALERRKFIAVQSAVSPAVDHSILLEAKKSQCYERFEWVRFGLRGFGTATRS